MRRTILSARCSVFKVRCSFIGEALRFYGAAHLCLSDTELSATECLVDKTVQLSEAHFLGARCCFTGEAQIFISDRGAPFLGSAAVLQERCSVFRGVCIFVSMRLSTTTVSVNGSESKWDMGNYDGL